MPSIIDFINTGTGANSGNGDSLRTAFNKINQNFTNLESTFVAAGVSSFNSQTGKVSFTATDITSLLGFTPYPDTNPLGFVSSSTVNLINYAQKSYVDTTFVTITDLADQNYVRKAYVDNALTEYATLAFINNQGYIVPSALPTYLSGYIDETELLNFDTQIRSYVTTTIRLAVSQNSIIPDIDNNFDLGAEEQRFRTLFLGNAMYIRGIGLTIDPATSRLYVDGNDIIGGFKFITNSIFSGDGSGFTFGSQYDIDTASPGVAYAYFPNLIDTNSGNSLKIVNTGTSGVVIQGKASSIEVDKGSSNRVRIVGDLDLPITFKGSGFLGNSPNVGDHKLKFTENSIVPINGTDVQKHVTISVEGTSTYQPLLLKGNRINFYAYDKFDQDRTGNELVDPAYVSLGTDGLAIGKNFANGVGDPSTPDSFDGYKLTLQKGAAGQFLIMDSDGVNTRWATVSGGVDFSNIAGHILPSLTVTYDLGSSSRQWRSLYVSSSTIYMSGVSLKVTSDGTVRVGNSIHKPDSLIKNQFEVNLDSLGNLTGFNFLGDFNTRVARSYLDYGGINFISGSVIKPTTSGKVHISGVTTSTGDVAQHVIPVGPQTRSWPAPPEIIDSYTKKVLNNEIVADPAWSRAYYSPSGLDANGNIVTIDVAYGGGGYVDAVEAEAENYMWAAENGTPTDPFDIAQWSPIPFSVLSGPFDVNLLGGGGGGGGGATNQLTNSTFNVTLDAIGNTTFPQDGNIVQKNSFIRTTDGNSFSSPTVIWAGKDTGITGVKMTIQVEGNETGDSTGWHTQVCEAIIAERYFGNAGTFDPQMTVYGVVHTSANPLATFTVQRNPTSHVIELVATPTATTTGTLYPKIHSVELHTRD